MVRHKARVRMYKGHPTALKTRMASKDDVGLTSRILGVTSPFFPGILLSRKPSETQGKRIRFLERMMVEKNGESTPRLLAPVAAGSRTTWFSVAAQKHPMPSQATLRHTSTRYTCPNPAHRSRPSSKGHTPNWRRLRNGTLVNGNKD